jgi:predicted nucleic acid-binding protein
MDANILIAVSAREPDKYVPALAQLAQYANAGSPCYAPGVIVAEALFALCRKLTNQWLTPVEHAVAVTDLKDLAQTLLPPPRGEAALIERAEQMRAGYGCSRSADGLYLALAEQLAQAGPVELVTFDVDLQRQAALVAPTVTVRLLRTV